MFRVLGLALLATVTIAAWSLWTRRNTWRSTWERAGTLTIALQTAAVILACPLTSHVVGPALHALTGMWNVEDFAAHCFFIFAAATLVYHALSRLMADHAAEFKTFVYYPIALTFPLRLGAFALSKGSHTYARDFFRLTGRPWLAVYWILVCGIVCYLLIYAARLLLILRRDAVHRRTANMYLAVIAAGLTVCAVRVVTAIDGEVAGCPIWWGCCFGSAGFALAFGYSWRRRARQLAGAA
ncbi:MAG TPA: hypothetical protein VGG84_15195 [Gemmatimonadaceae bacterium]